MPVLSSVGLICFNLRNTQFGLNDFLWLIELSTIQAPVPLALPASSCHILFQKTTSPRTSLLVPWLRLHAFNAGGTSSIPGQGIRSHVLQGEAKNRQTHTHTIKTQKNISLIYTYVNSYQTSILVLFVQKGFKIIVRVFP